MTYQVAWGSQTGSGQLDFETAIDAYAMLMQHKMTAVDPWFVIRRDGAVIDERALMNQVNRDSGAQDNA